MFVDLRSLWEPTSPTSGLQPVEPWLCDGPERHLHSYLASTFIKGVALYVVAAAVSIPRPVQAVEAPLPVDYQVSSFFGASDLPLLYPRPPTRPLALDPSYPIEGAASLVGNELPLLYPRPPTRPLYVDQSSPIEGDGTILARALEFPLQSTPFSRPLVFLDSEQWETPRENTFNRYFFAPAAPQTPPTRPLYLGPQEWPDTLVSTWAKQAPLQAPVPKARWITEPPFDPDVSTAVFEKRVPVQAKPRPFLLVEYDVPIVSQAGISTAIQFPVLQPPPGKPYLSLDAPYPIEGFGQLNPYFPGNFPALQSPPLKPWVVLDYDLPEQLPSIWLIPGVFIPPAVTPTPQAPDLTGAGQAKRRYQKRYQIEVDGQVFEVRSEEEAVYILDQLREQAKTKAQEVIQRAQKAERRPKRKILSDARRALVPPEITVNRWAENLVPNISSEIEYIYQDALKTIEIGLFLRIREELDDEEAILLLI